MEVTQTWQTNYTFRLPSVPFFFINFLFLPAAFRKWSLTRLCCSGVQEGIRDIYCFRFFSPAVTSLQARTGTVEQVWGCLWPQGGNSKERNLPVLVDNMSRLCLLILDRSDTIQFTCKWHWDTSMHFCSSCSLHVQLGKLSLLWQVGQTKCWMVCSNRSIAFEKLFEEIHGNDLPREKDVIRTWRGKAEIPISQSEGKSNSQ